MAPLFRRRFRRVLVDIDTQYDMFWHSEHDLSILLCRIRRRFQSRTVNDPSVSFWDLPEPKSTPTCTQLDWFDEFEAKIDDHDDICIECFNDLEFDGFSNYHCKGCDSWFTEDEVVRSRFQ